MSEQTTEQQKVLSITDIDGTLDTQYLEVYVPEWKGTVRLGSLPAGEMLEWAESNEGKARRTAGLRLLIKSLVDADGNRIGRDEHLQVFRKKDHSVIARLVDEILKLNKLDEKGKKEAKNGSGETDGGDSPTVLH